MIESFRFGIPISLEPDFWGSKFEKKHTIIQSKKKNVLLNRIINPGLIYSLYMKCISYQIYALHNGVHWVDYCHFQWFYTTELILWLAYITIAKINKNTILYRIYSSKNIIRI